MTRVPDMTRPLVERLTDFELAVAVYTGRGDSREEALLALREANNAPDNFNLALRFGVPPDFVS